MTRITVLFILLATPALAADLPRLDVDGACARLAAQTHGGLNQCIMSAQLGYNKLVVFWPRLTPDEQRRIVANPMWNSSYEAMAQIAFYILDQRAMRDALQRSDHFRPQN